MAPSLAGRLVVAIAWRALFDFEEESGVSQARDEPTGESLREFELDCFFDDQTGNIESAAHHVPAGHVAAGMVIVPRP